MDHWQRLRLDRSKQDGLQCDSVVLSDKSALFDVDGVTDGYLVDISYDVTLWPPSCTCEDNAWRGPELLCKHIVFVLSLLGVDEEFLSDCLWEPSQLELCEYLSVAPDCVGHTVCTRGAQSSPRQQLNIKKKFHDRLRRMRVHNTVSILPGEASTET